MTDWANDPTPVVRKGGFITLSVNPTSKDRPRSAPPAPPACKESCANRCMAVLIGKLLREHLAPPAALAWMDHHRCARKEADLAKEDAWSRARDEEERAKEDA